MDTKYLAAQTALKGMIKEGYINICTIDKIGSLLDLPLGGDAYNTLHTLHCISFSEMPPELKEKIPSLIEECLSTSAINIDLSFLHPDPAKRSLLSLIR